MGEDIKKLYEERRKRVEQACNHIEPDRVPVLSQVNNFGIGYGGHSIQEVYEDLDLERQCYSKALTDFYCDTVVTFGVGFPFIPYINAGSHTYCVAPNGYTVMHMESSSMKFEEYDELFADPAKFIANRIAYRKIDCLHKPYPECYNDLETLYKEIDRHAANVSFNTGYAKDVLGLPLMAKGAAGHPLDVLFDFIRGFKETLLDIRRHPELVHKAIDVLTPFYWGTMPQERRPEEFPYPRNTAHCPTFLSTKQFEEFYLPYVKKCVEQCVAMGTKYLFFCEGTWAERFETFRDLPKSSIVSVLENDDAIETKKKYGDFMTLAGGYRQADLKFGTPEQMKDIAKKYIDECAPGGGYLFTGDKSFLAVEDINFENYKTITDFAHEYGKYNK